MVYFSERLKLVDPTKLLTYLKNKDWQEDSTIDTGAIVLTIQKNTKKYSILLPIDKTVPDYISRLYDVFRTLEIVENEFKEVILTSFIQNQDYVD